jgi:hypothetical protein
VAFGAVVVLTMFAAMSFDPRLIWDPLADRIHPTMTEPTTPALPAATVDAPRRFRMPLVWIIPLVAALIGLFLAARTWYEQGPTITIQFSTGPGLEPGKTRIKYKDVDVGQIMSVALAEDGAMCRHRQAGPSGRPPAGG